MSKNVGFRLEFEGSKDSINDLAKIEIELKDIVTQINALKKAGGLRQNREEFQKLRAEQIKLQASSKDLRKEIADQKRTFDAQKFPKDSLIGMRMEYNKLSKQIDQLDAQARKSTFGQDLIKQARDLNNEIKNVEGSVGNFRRNVGNYPGGGFLGQFGAGTLRAGLGPAGALVAGPLAAGALGVTALVSNLGIIRDFEQGLADLGAISRTTGEDLDKMKQNAKDLGATTAFSATQVLALQTELAKLGFNADEIVSMTKSVIDLGIALDADAGRAAQLTGAVLRAYGKDVKEADNVTNALGKTALISASNFSTLETQIPIVGAVAKTFGFGLEDTLALLGELSNRGFDASSSATALRNIFLNLADANGKLAMALGGPAKSLPELVEKMKMLRTTGIDLGETLELTDKRSVAAFNSFLDGADNVLVLREELNDLDGVLDDLTSKKLDTFRGKVTLLNSAWQGFALSIDEGNGAFSRFSKAVLDTASAALTALTAYNDGLFQFATTYEKTLLKAGDTDTVAGIRNRLNFRNLSNDEKIAFRIDKISDEERRISEYSNVIEKLKDKIIFLDHESEEYNKTLDRQAFFQEKLDKLKNKEIVLDEKTIENKIENNKKTKELIRGSIEFLENEVRLAEAALKRTVLTDDSAINTAIAKLEKVKKDLDEARKRITQVDEDDIKTDLEMLELLKQVRIQNAVETITDQKQLAETIRDINEQSEIEILKLKIDYAKDGSKEKITLENQLQLKYNEIAERGEKERADAFKKSIADTLAELDKEASKQLIALNSKFRDELGIANADVDSAPDVQSYKSAIERKKQLEKKFQEDVLRISKETELKKVQTQLQFESENSDKYIDLKLREEQLITEIVRLGESERDKLREASFQKEVERAKMRFQIIQESIDFLAEASRTFYNIEADRIDYNRDKRLEALDADFERRKELAGTNTELQKRIDEEYEADRKKIEREAFESQKRAAKLQAVIQGALATIKLFVSPGLPAALGLLPFVAGNTALQIATINAQRFALGGKVKRYNDTASDVISKAVKLSAGRITASPNHPATPDGDNILSLVKRNEVILNEQQQSRLGGAKTFRAIGVPGFAFGGRVDDFDYSKPPYALSRPSEGGGSIGMEEMSMLAKMIASEVRGAVLEGSMQGAMQGSLQGTREGTFEGLNESERIRERRLSAQQKNTF
jgi:TP901 family phage tail tape measure protein